MRTQSWGVILLGGTVPVGPAFSAVGVLDRLTFYEQARTTATTDLNDDIGGCVLENSRRVVAFRSATQITPGVACELFFMDAPPVAIAKRRES